MNVFVTGATGYIGSYVVSGLLQNHPNTRLSLLVRAKNIPEAERRLWKSLQLHMSFPDFLTAIRERCTLLLGSLTAVDLGFDATTQHHLVHETESILHVAASLNRRSSKSCYNTNLRGTLAVLQLARKAHADHGLRRFTQVSTIAVAGVRKHEVVQEDGMVSWDRSDYDTYSRTKKFAEHLSEELLPDVSRLVLRPSIVLGDSRFPETTQFDIAKAFAWLASLRVLPFHESWRLDLIPADYVGKAIVELHQRPHNEHTDYNLSAGLSSPTYGEIVRRLRDQKFGNSRIYLPFLDDPVTALARLMALAPKGWPVTAPAALMSVFMPYLTSNTVYDNQRVTEALGEAPVPFLNYACDLMGFLREGGFRYPYKPWPMN